MKKKKVYLLCGCPGSGKSFYTRTQSFLHSDGTIVISRDKIRFSLVDEKEGYFSKEKEVFKAFIKEINMAISSLVIDRIYIDATHITETSRNKVLDKLNLENVDLYAVNFLTPVERCINRNDLREGRANVPREAIYRMAKDFQPAAINEKYKYKEIINIKP